MHAAIDAAAAATPVHGPRHPPDKGISARYVILSIPLPAVIMSHGEIANDGVRSEAISNDGAFADL